jgi:hypothetical protein
VAKFADLIPIHLKPLQLALEPRVPCAEIDDPPKSEVLEELGKAGVPSELSESLVGGFRRLLFQGEERLRYAFTLFEHSDELQVLDNASKSSWPEFVSREKGFLTPEQFKELHTGRLPPEGADLTWNEIASAVQRRLSPIRIVRLNARYESQKLRQPRLKDFAKASIFEFAVSSHTLLSSITKTELDNIAQVGGRVKEYLRYLKNKDGRSDLSRFFLVRKSSGDLSYQPELLKKLAYGLQGLVLAKGLQQYLSTMSLQTHLKIFSYSDQASLRATKCGSERLVFTCFIRGYPGTTGVIIGPRQDEYLSKAFDWEYHNKIGMKPIYASDQAVDLMDAEIQAFRTAGEKAIEAMGDEIAMKETDMNILRSQLKNVIDQTKGPEDLEASLRQMTEKLVLGY